MVEASGPAPRSAQVGSGCGVFHIHHSCQEGGPWAAGAVTHAYDPSSLAINKLLGTNLFSALLSSLAASRF